MNKIPKHTNNQKPQENTVDGNGNYGNSLTVVA